MNRTFVRLPAPAIERAPAGAILVAGIMIFAALTTAHAATVVIQAAKDNTLYQDPNGAFSSGAGQNFFVGRVDVISTGELRRGVIAFNIAAAVPAGATITSVRLTLNMSRTTTGLQPVSLHRLLADWGEAGSVAPGGGGNGAPAQPGDATWLHRFYNTVLWTRAGGDFVATASTTIQVGLAGQYTFLSTPGMVADAQSWLDTPATNFGWIVIGNESVLATAKRFDTKENIIASTRPALTVDFTTAAPGSGSVPDGGPVPGIPLSVAHATGGDLRLSWGASCSATDTDYAVYAGAMPDFTTYSPLACSTGGLTSIILTPTAANQFYLVVPRNAGREGSYGTASNGLERPPGAGACLQQSIAACP